MSTTKAQSPIQQRLQKRYSPHSPSRKLQFDLEHALEQLILHDHEVSKVHAYQRRSIREELDARDSARTKAHTAAIDAAKAKHEAVREEAEAVLRHHLKEQEEDRRRKEEEERQRQEREAREKIERECKAREEREAREQAEREAKEDRERKEFEARKAAEAAQEKKNEQELLEKERRSNEAAAEAASKAKAEKEEADRKALQQQKDQQANRAKTTAASLESGLYSSSPEAEAHHNEYLALHKKLKQFRNDFWEQAKKDKQLKAVVGDMRRAMRTSVGQLTDDKVGNRQATDRVKQAITQSLTSITSPPMPVNDFLPPHLHLPSSTPPQIPSLTAYLLSIFSKALIAAFTNEVAVSPRAAEPIGTLAAQVFSLPDLQYTNSTLPQGYQTTSLISILMAKYHRVAPPLFGISGPESTPAGRTRLGWRIESSAPVSEQRHHERMTGLGAGYSSLALRNFSKTRLTNPYPPRHFWSSLAHIVNTPPVCVTTSHLLLLKAMLDNNAVDRFVLFFGDAGIAALREAAVEFPRRLTEGVRKGAAARSLGIMVDSWGVEKMFHLE